MFNNNKLPTNRSFGIVIGLVLFTLSLIYPNNLLLTLSIIFFILGIADSKILSPLNFIWMNFGKFLARVINPIILLIIFLLLFIPMGLILKLIKKDILDLKIDKSLKTLWKNSLNKKQSLKNQY